MRSGSRSKRIGASPLRCARKAASVASRPAPSAVVNVDALTYAASLENFPEAVRRSPRFEFVYGNVRSPLLVESLVARDDVVVHFAAETHVPRSISDNLIFFETDVLGTQTLSSAVVRHRGRIERFVHVSTSEVYGDPQVHPQEESYYGYVNPIGPRGVYDEAKRFAEAMTMAYHTYHGVETRIVRIFNTYGPRMHPNDGRVVSNLIVSALEGRDLTIAKEGGASARW